jgi:hypothetical protein
LSGIYGQADDKPQCLAVHQRQFPRSRLQQRSRDREAKTDGDQSCIGLAAVFQDREDDGPRLIAEPM